MNAKSGRNQRFRDSIHGFIWLTPTEEKLVDHPRFQRLRNIHQLSSGFLVYPGATHTRFEHSLGVMELATQAFQCLKTNSEDKLNTLIGKDNVDFCEQALRVAALLHDIGHTPFSHVGEDICDIHHEDITYDIVSNDLKSIIEENGEGLHECVLGILRDGNTQSPIEQLCKQIIKGQLDVDRIDYLTRDSRYTGVKYGNIDIQRIISALGIMSGTSPVPEIIIYPSGVHAVEGLILSRHFMYAQVYFNKHVAKLDSCLKKYMEHFYKSRNITDGEKPVNKMSVIDFDDYDVLNQMRNENDKNAKLWSDRFLSRAKEFKCYLESSDYVDKHELNFINKTISQLKKIEGIELIEVPEKKDRIHKYRRYKVGQISLVCRKCESPMQVGSEKAYLIRGLSCSTCHEKEAFAEPEDFFEGVDQLNVVLDKETEYAKPITQISTILGKIPVEYKVHRIYASGDEKLILENIRKMIKQEEAGELRIRVNQYESH